MKPSPPSLKSPFLTLLLGASTISHVRERQQWPAFSTAPGYRSMGMLFITVLSLLATHVSAALVTSFSNCLPESVQQSPTHLQFRPLAVDAKLELGKVPYRLNVTVYGNVTGSSSANPGGNVTKRWEFGLVDQDFSLSTRHEREARISRRRYRFTVDSVEDQMFANSGTEGQEIDKRKYLVRRDDISYETTGEIVQFDSAWGTNTQTTLRTTVNVVTFQLFDGYDGFCTNAKSCPMKNTPLPNNGDLSDPSGLPSFTVSTILRDSYAFTSVISTFRIISGDSKDTHIGCVKVEVTPPLGNAISNAVRWTPLGILIFVGLATISAAIFNPWNGTKDIFRWSSNYGMDDDMLRLVTPGFGDCLQYLQFVVLTGSLTLAYPGFVQPVLSKGAWSVLLFNTTVTPDDSTSSLVDNLYVVDGKYGLERMAKFVGISNVKDIWPVSMIYVVGILIAVVSLIQIGFVVRWGFMKVKSIAEEDLRAKNRPFTLGNIIRLFFNYLLNPFITFTTFQFVLHDRSPAWYTGLSATVFAIFILLTALMLRQIATHKPRSALCDDLPTLLQYGPIYNTYRLESNPFFCTMQIIINILRAVAFGGVQDSGIAQLTLLVICEVLLILLINAVRPYSPKTSMNLYQTFFSAMRLLTVVFSMAFIPQLKIDDAAKGWVAYAVLLCHGIVLVFGFFLNALQTLAEIIARLMGAGNDGGTAARGGLAQVFGKRQLSRRSNRHETAYHPAHRHTDSSGTPSLIAGPEGDRKLTFSGSSRPALSVTGGGHVNNNSIGAQSDNAALVGLLDPNSPGTVGRGHKHTGSGSTAYTPTSPVVASYPPTLGGGGVQNTSGAIVGLGVIASSGPDPGPYYRPPRTRTNTVGMADSPNARSRGSWASGDWTTPRYDAAGNPITPTGSRPFSRTYSASLGSFQGGGRAEGVSSEDWDSPTVLNTNNPNSGAGTPPPFGALQGPGSVRHQHTDSTLGGSGRGRTDYAVREMDFYYGVRGPALSSTAPSRKLGTGPADPTSPMAIAKGWLLNKFGRRKEKAKGFEVVRSSRAPEMLSEMQEAAEQARREQQAKASQDEIGVAVTRDGDDSNSSDDEDDGAGERRVGSQIVKTTTDSEEESDDSEGGGNSFGEGPSRAADSGRNGLPPLPPLNTGDDTLSRSFSLRSQAGVDGAPKVPRKSSKRRSATQLLLDHGMQSSMPSDSQQPEVGIVITPTPTRGHELYDPPLSSQVHLRHLQTQQEQNRNSSYLHSSSSTRLPFQTPSMDSRSSKDDRNLAVDGTNSTPGNSRNNSNASSILPPVPGLYGNRGGDSGSVSGSIGGQVRPASVGTVSRHRMEDSLTEVTDQRALVVGMGSTAELVERSNSLASNDGEGNMVAQQGESETGRRRYSFE
ncbi:hypothetical protein BDZ91DRAFT_732569 [Kalaharituber pfeilii]|nr:hypothetical protein BDZ91DRAFT_732569 [Kalaharituber pfeilii]